MVSAFYWNVRKDLLKYILEKVGAIGSFIFDGKNEFRFSSERIQHDGRWVFDYLSV